MLYGSRFVGWFARVKGVLTLANQPPSRVRVETEILCENSHVIAFRSDPPNFAKFLSKPDPPQIVENISRNSGLGQGAIGRPVVSLLELLEALASWRADLTLLMLVQADCRTYDTFCER